MVPVACARCLTSHHGHACLQRFGHQAGAASGVSAWRVRSPVSSLVHRIDRRETTCPRTNFFRFTDRPPRSTCKSLQRARMGVTGCRNRVSSFTSACFLGLRSPRKRTISVKGGCPSPLSGVGILVGGLLYMVVVRILLSYIIVLVSRATHRTFDGMA